MARRRRKNTVVYRERPERKSNPPDMSGIMNIALIGGAVYGAYWYITNYPKTGPTYYQQWFGGAPAQTALPPATGVPAGAVTVPNAGTGIPSVYVPVNTTPPGGTTTTPPVTTAPPNTALRTSLLDHATGGGTWSVPVTNGLTVDQWAFSYNQLKTPLTNAQIDQAIAVVGGNRNVLMNVDQFLAAIATMGLGDIIPVPNMPSFRGNVAATRAGARIVRAGATKGWVQ